MHEITVHGFRLPFQQGSSVPGMPDVKLGRKIGGSPYTFNRIYDLLDKNGQQTGLVIKVCWQPLGIPLSMSMRALLHEWVMYKNIQVFCTKHPELDKYFIHAHTAIFISNAPQTPPTSGAAAAAPTGAESATGHHETTAAAAATIAGTETSLPTGAAAPVPVEGTDKRHNTIFLNSSSSSSSSSGSSGTIAAIILEKANGKPVKQTIKPKTWADANYLAQLLLQLPHVVAVLEGELGFVHDDLRLDNVLEQWQQQQQQQPSGKVTSSTRDGSSSSSAHQNREQPQPQQQQPGQCTSNTGDGSSSSSAHQNREQPQPQQQQPGQCTSNTGDGSSSSSAHQNREQPQPQQQQPGQCTSNTGDGSSSSSSAHQNREQHPSPQQQQQQQQQCAPGSPVSFKLFDFGLSMVNPDRFSLGSQARATPQQKKAALQQLQQQGYYFHKALGWVSLAHVVQFGRAADLYRFCQSLAKNLKGRVWPAEDRALVEACLQLLAAVSGMKITATFTDDWQQHHIKPQQQQQQQQSGSSICGTGDSSTYHLPVKVRLQVQITPESAAAGNEQVGNSSRSAFAPLKGLAHWVEQTRMDQQLQRKARRFTAQQFEQLPMYKELAALVESRR